MVKGTLRNGWGRLGCGVMILATCNLPAAPVISEFLAGNDTVLADEDGDYSDWIEIHNPDDVAVDLAGWRLTDNSLDSAKWVFPSRVLEPGGFLIVFASGKDRAGTTGELHTNFALSKDGEYLALASPAGVPSTVFDPAFPAQEDDRSYGIPFQTVTHLGEGSPVSYRVPTDGADGLQWTMPGYPEGAAWSNGSAGLGFGILIPGLLVTEAFQPGVDLSNLSIAQSVLSSASSIKDVRVRQTVNMYDDSGSDHFAANVPPMVANDNFAIKATGFVNIPTSRVWTFGMRTDDGCSLRIDGQVVIFDDVRRAATDTFASINLSQGLHAIEMLFFENGGGAQCELFAAPGTWSSWSSSFRLIGDTGNGGLEALTLPEGASGGAGVVSTDIAGVMQGVNPSIQSRQSFTVDPAEVDLMTASFFYNDGFVAFLNGTEVARRNAPTTLAWNSAAEEERPVGLALIPETINLTGFKPLLTAGTNTLAVQGLSTGNADTSFALLPVLKSGTRSTGDYFFFEEPSPGGLNDSPVTLGSVADTKFSVGRGVYDAPVSVEITTDTPDATIRYTLDGSKPTESTGQIYQTPLTITTTTVLRAAAFKTGYEPTNVDTNTYIFPADVIASQLGSAVPAGWPTAPVNGQIYDYGLDPDIVNGNEAAVVDSLKSLPVISLSFKQEDMTGVSGIYSNPGGHGFAWEREGCIEMFNDPVGPGFQENAGLRIRGNFSRSTDNPKHAFRIFFRKDYGAGKLDYPIFGSDGAQEFDKFDVQTAQNYSWAFEGSGQNTFLREIWSRDTGLEMGRLNARGKFVHLYLNGIYWGLYSIEERPEADFGASYLGGDADDFDVIKATGGSGGYTTEATDGLLTGPPGDPAAWEDLWNKAKAHAASPTYANFFRMQGLAADGVTPNGEPNLLDVDNLIDYLAIIFYTGNGDSPVNPGFDQPNNFYSLRDRTGDRGFAHVLHDCEHTLDAPGASVDRTQPGDAAKRAEFIYSNPLFMHHDLTGNLEYRTRFGDRVQHWMFGDGLLTTEAAIARMERRRDEIAGAILAESARWGDSKRSVPFTESDWQNAVNGTLGWFNGRGDIVLGQFRSAGLYPSMDAPVYLPQPGQVALGQTLGISSSQGTIYYRLDGLDPRLVGGGIRPGTLTTTGVSNQDTTLIPFGASGWRYLDTGIAPPANWNQPGFSTTGWKTGTAELGYGDNDEATVISQSPTGSAPRNITNWFHMTFGVSSGAQPYQASISLVCDDGAVVYLDGVEIARSNMPSGVITATTGALSTISGSAESTPVEYSFNPSLLTPGLHVLAAEVHQFNASSSDVSFNLELKMREAVNPDPIPLDGPGLVTVTSRVRMSSGAWSALNSGDYEIGVVAPSPLDLRITEILFDPPVPSALEQAAGFTDATSFEFLEIGNVGSETVDLRGLVFTDGIEFAFPEDGPAIFLPPGGRVVVVEDLAAFRARYGEGPLVAGQYAGALANEGERVALEDADGNLIAEVTYGVDGGWPAIAGHSLVAIDPGRTTDWNDAGAWRASVSGGGNPSSADFEGYGQWKAALHLTDNNGDDDGDGYTTFEEYAYGGDPFAPSSGLGPRAGVSPAASGQEITLVFPRRTMADDVEFVVQRAEDLASWQDVPATRISELPQDDGTSEWAFRVDQPDASEKAFYRLEIRLRE